jgi:DNA-binding protein H-NS
VRTPEQEAALRAILKLMNFWGIAPEELAVKKTAAAVVAPAIDKEAAKPSVKYRHPVSGDTWNGEGSQPEWLRLALTYEGYTVDALRVQPPVASMKDA